MIANGAPVQGDREQKGKIAAHIRFTTKHVYLKVCLKRAQN